MSYVSNFFDKLKFGKNQNNDHRPHQLSSANSSRDSFEVVGTRNALNFPINSTNFASTMSQDLNPFNRNNFHHQNRAQTDRVVNHLNKSETIFPKSLSTKTSTMRLSGSQSELKKRANRKHLSSFCLEDRERYKLLLNSHICSPHLDKMSTIASLNSRINRPKKQEIIDLSSSVDSSSSVRNQLTPISDGYRKEKLDIESKNNLVERIRSAGIVAQPFISLNTTSNTTHSTPFVAKTPYKNISMTPNKFDIKTELPESSKKFNDLLKDKKNFLETHWIQDLRSSLNQSNLSFDNKITQSEQRVLESKNKRQTDCENLKSFIRVPFTRSELSPFVPFCQLQEQLLEDIEEEEDEEDIEEEIAKDLPLLTPEMDQMIDDALRPTPPNEILSEAFSITITRKDMETLSGLNWLNDEVFFIHI